MKKSPITLILMALLTSCTNTNSDTDETYISSLGSTTVQTAAGRLIGSLQGGIYNFRGIPYARAERFMLPEPAAAWDGIRPAVTYGEICHNPPMSSVSNDELFNPHRYGAKSEDCQFLNVWTPSISDDKRRPVMVWLHGGGFTNGSSIEMVAYDGANLSNKGDVVVVTLNHRLNVLGFLDLSAYGDKYKYSGNVGMADIVVALEWVQANIEQFGGDPANVTIFGQSGGGSKVRTLMGLPAADGLFHRAIVQSGATSSPVQAEQAAAQRVAELTLENLGLLPDQVDQLADVPYLQLIEASSNATDRVEEEGKFARVGWRPVVDGDYLPTNPVDEEWVEQARDIPLLIGTVLNESTNTVTGGHKPGDLLADNKNLWSTDRAKAKVAERFGDKADAVAAAFLKAYPNKTYADAYFVDTRSRPGTMNNTLLKARQGGAPVYSYVFAWESPVMDGIGMSWHCSEIPHVFNNAMLVPTATGGGPDAQAMSHRVSQAWINFARHGDPSHDDLPDWPAYTVDGGATMIFDNVSDVRFHHDSELFEVVASN
ncbi:MAG: carboxylesterase family protein [Gammaproteobacteria bacterium]|nr:carboxylesterase family protein [Gammaproteobacteria bacterium]